MYVITPAVWSTLRFTMYAMAPAVWSTFRCTMYAMTPAVWSTLRCTMYVMALAVWSTSRCTMYVITPAVWSTLRCTMYAMAPAVWSTFRCTMYAMTPAVWSTLRCTMYVMALAVWSTLRCTMYVMAPPVWSTLRCTMYVMAPAKEQSDLFCTNKICWLKRTCLSCGSFPFVRSVYQEALFNVITIWAATWENVPSDMFTRHRLKSACASAQSDQGLQCPVEETLHPCLSSEEFDQTALMYRLNWIFQWAHRSEGRFSGGS